MNIQEEFLQLSVSDISDLRGRMTILRRVALDIVCNGSNSNDIIDTAHGLVVIAEDSLQALDNLDNRLDDLKASIVEKYQLSWVTEADPKILKDAG